MAPTTADGNGRLRTGQLRRVTGQNANAAILLTRDLFAVAYLLVTYLLLVQVNGRFANHSIL